MLDQGTRRKNHGGVKEIYKMYIHRENKGYTASSRTNTCNRDSMYMVSCCWKGGVRIRIFYIEDAFRWAASRRARDHSRATTLPTPPLGALKQTRGLSPPHPWELSHINNQHQARVRRPRRMHPQQGAPPRQDPAGGGFRA